MKILVVDDEQLARESIIRILINLGYDSISEAVNGIEAFNYILAKKPDLVLADIRMPEMDGLECLKKVKEQGYNTIFVFISAFDFFDYTRKAIKFGAFDYILKPVKESDFKTVLDNVEKSIEQQNKNHQSQLETKIKLSQDIRFKSRHILQDLALREFSDSNVDKTFSELGLDFQESNFCVVVISIDNLSSQITNMPIDDMSLLRLSIENIANEFLEINNIKAYFFDIDDGSACLLNYKLNDTVLVLQKLNPIFIEIKSTISNFLKNSVTIGIGSNTNHYSGIPFSYTSACNALSQRLVKGINKVFCYDELNKHVIKKDMISIKTEHDIITLFEMCNYEGVLEIITELYTPIKQYEIIDTKILFRMNLQLILVIYKIVEKLDLHPEKLLGDEFLLYKEVNSCDCIDSIINWFTTKIKICEAAISAKGEKSYKKLFYKALEYIHQNIANDITLESTADSVHLSPNYFSKVFKLEFGETFLDYVMKHRISKAKDLLRNSFYKANEVSALVGFKDEKHFYKVFKKITGLTPGEYKKQG